MHSHALALRRLALPLLLILTLQALHAGEAPAPAPAPQPAAQADSQTQEDAATATDTRPWSQRLWDRLQRDYARRFDVRQWSLVVQHLFDSLLVLLVAGAGIWIMHRFLRRLSARMERLHGVMQRRKVETISSLVYSTAKYAIYIACALWILSIWGIDTQSLVVGSAVVGAAIGFGSQGLVQDIIVGLSILAEEQLSVGDFVEICGRAGAVEEVGLRVVKLRDHLGVQHVIFNRTISMVSNFTAGGVQALVDISLTSAEQAEAAQRVATQVCRDLASETPYFRGTPEIEGVHESSTKDVFLRLVVRVLPQQEGVIQPLLVERLKHAFAAEKIDIPDGRVRVILLSDLFSKAMNKADATAQDASPGKILEN
jgi:small conductance mechanosensitive channel